LAKSAGQPGAADRLTDSAELLLDQARIVEGEPLPDPAAFARRLSAVMAKGVAG
jgi:molecular chaperone HtpG